MNNIFKSSKKIKLKNIDCNQYTEIIHTFELDGNSENTTLYVCSETEYVAYINSEFVGTGQYRTHSKRIVYDSYDVSNHILNEKNEIRIISYHQGRNTSTCANKEPFLIYSLWSDGNNLAVSGEETLIRPFLKYRNGDIELSSRQLGYVYHYDANIDESLWETPVVEEITEPLEPRPVKKLVHMPLVEGEIFTQGYVMRTTSGTVGEMMLRDFLSYADKNEIFEGKTVKQNRNGVYFVIDLGNEYAGLFDMDITAPKGTVINIGYGEHLDDMRVRTHVGGRNFACSYVCKDGRQKFTGYFRRFAARYVEIHILNMSDDVEFHSIGLIPTDYPIKNVPYFKCDNQFFNKLFDVSVNTMKLCMHEHYEDCPWREQAMYAFDSYVQMLCGYYAFGEYDFPRESLRLIAEGQREDGLLEMCAPGCPSVNIPSFSLCWIISLEKYVLYSGDIDFARKYIHIADSILSSFKIKDGIIHNNVNPPNWCFYEWTPGLDGEHNYETDAPINLYYIIACEAYNKLCSYIGIKEKYDCALMKIKVKEAFYNADAGLFVTVPEDNKYHEFTQSLAILAGVADDDMVELLVRGDNRLIGVSLSTSLYKYDAILKFGTKHLDAVIENIYEVWSKMIYSGCNTLWETIDGANDFENAGSLCHAWSAVPVYVIYKYVLGYEPLSPGFKKFSSEMHKNKYIQNADAVLYRPGNN